MNVPHSKITVYIDSICGDLERFIGKTQMPQDSIGPPHTSLMRNENQKIIRLEDGYFLSSEI
jgi:hypothetical protein